MTDQYHAAAGKLSAFLREYRHLLTTTLVVAESYVLRLGQGHAAAVRFLDLLEASRISCA